jgi:hypothetical protein
MCLLCYKNLLGFKMFTCGSGHVYKTLLQIKALVKLLFMKETFSRTDLEVICFCPIYLPISKYFLLQGRCY